MPLHVDKLVALRRITEKPKKKKGKKNKKGSRSKSDDQASEALSQMVYDLKSRRRQYLLRGGE